MSSHKKHPIKIQAWYGKDYHATKPQENIDFQASKFVVLFDTAQGTTHYIANNKKSLHEPYYYFTAETLEVGIHTKARDKSNCNMTRNDYGYLPRCQLTVPIQGLRLESNYNKAP